MTHPTSSLPIPVDQEDGKRNLESHNDTHESSDLSTKSDSSSLVETSIVEDYIIVPQDAPLEKRPAIYTSGDLYTFLATSQETNFSFNAFDFFVPQGGGPPPHIHNFEHEAFFVEEGQVSFFLGNEAGALDISPGEKKEEYILKGLPEGTFIFGPRLRPLGFANPNSNEAVSGANEGARILSLTTPGGLDLLFEFAGIPVEDRNQMILPPSTGIDPKQLEFGQRTGGGIAFSGYEPPKGTPNYILVLPEDTPQELEDNIRNQISGIDGFSVFKSSQRPTFTGGLGIEYTSLLTLEETGGEMEYNQFSLDPQETETSGYASLSAEEVVEPTNSSATATANLQLNEAGEIEYSLTVSGLDLGELTTAGTSQTPDNELDDVTQIHLHSGEVGSNGSDVFNILDPQKQQETELQIDLNENGSATISGIWNPSESVIPQELKDFLSGDNLPGETSDFYLQIHTKGNTQGEIRGQIGLTSDDFTEPIVSNNHETLYVKDGYLSLKIDDEVKLVEPNTFVYIAPNQEYAVGNFGTETVDSLAVSIPEQPESPREIISPLKSPADSSAYTDVFLGAEADLFNQPEQSERRVYGGQGNDQIFAEQGDRLFGEEGDDILDASRGKNNNLLDGGAGDDELLGASDGELVGGDGDDILRIFNGGNNLLYGGDGADQFWLANDSIADTVTETRQLTDLGLPNLEDTRNTIVDFEQDVDKIGISGVSGISSFDDLKLLPAFGDLKSTSIIATVDGIEGEISLGNILDVRFNQLDADDFVFT